MAAVRGVLRSVLSDQVKERLLEDILLGRYQPGARIIESQVARELNTSQAPVREALRDLEGLGVIEIERFKGARVRKPSIAELSEALEIRGEMERRAARLAVDRMGESILAALDRDIETMVDAANREDRHAQAAADARFHARIVGSSGNGTIERVWRFLEPNLRTQITQMSARIDAQHLTTLHAPIAAAFRARDPAAAQKAIDMHFLGVESMLRDGSDRAQTRTSGEAGSTSSRTSAAAVRPGLADLERAHRDDEPT